MIKNIEKQNVEKRGSLIKTQNNGRVIWYDGRNLKNEKQILPLIFQSRFEYLIIKQSSIAQLKLPKKMKLIVEVEDAKNLNEIPADSIILSEKIEVLENISNYKKALYYFINDEKGMDEAWRLGGKADFLIADFKDVTNIPLELLIARLQGSSTNILKVVNNLQDINIAFGIMEAGSDGCVFKTENLKEIKSVDNWLGRIEESKIQLSTGIVVDVEHIGMGYRSCIDTTSILKKNEGMIIGSTSIGGLLVSSETHYLPYMELRPFRVNAGAIHSYVWCPGGETSYLTELKVGSKVTCVDTDGNSRTVSVGRVKTELRPLLKIEVKIGYELINAIVQDDWHIRIFGENGEPRNASLIKEGDKMLVYLCNGGRHVGIKIDENCIEK